MSKKKQIQNYQIIQLLQQIQAKQGKYQIYKAKHIIQKQYFTLKKIKIKNDKNHQLYESFLYQASLLKGIKHPNIVKSIKMMKTVTSIYVVYDYWTGQSLTQWMEKGYKKSIEQKQSIIKQLTHVLSQLFQNCIAHLTLNPDNIYINEQGDVKIINFLYGSILPQNGQQIQLQNKVPKSQFTPPQVKLGKACLNSDIYSYGKIIQFMDLQTSKKGTITTKQFNVKVQEYKQIIKITTKRNPSLRIYIQQAYKLVFKKKAKLRSLHSMSMSLLKTSSRQSLSSSKTIQTSTASNAVKSQFVKDIVLLLLKKRNMAKMLIDIFKIIITLKLQNSTTKIILATLLLKKSTVIMNNIAKFIKYGKGIIGMQLNQKQRSKFFKSGDYFKLQPLIDKQVKQQRKHYQLALETIFLENVKILQNKKFNIQLKKQQIDQHYFRQIMKTFISEGLQQLESEQNSDNLNNFLRTLFLIGNILDNGGIELFFDQKVKLYPIDLMQQAIFIKIFKQQKQKDILYSLDKYKISSNSSKFTLKNQN